MGYRSTIKTVYPARYGIIWCPKYRRRLLTGRVETRLEQIFARVVDEAGGRVIEVEVMADHVHVVAEVPATVALSGLVPSLRGRSSRVFRVEFPALRRSRVLWSLSWFVSTVGGAPLEVVRGYVEYQKTAA